MNRVINSNNQNDSSQKSRLIVALLFFLSVIAIIFTTLVIQIQSGATSYLSGLTYWSRGQSETVKRINDYLYTGNHSALKQAKFWYQIPLGDMQARRPMESKPPDYEAAREGLLKGQNHPDDITRMIWVFRLFREFPYFKEAVEAWRQSDDGVLKLGELIEQLETDSEPFDPASHKADLLRLEVEQLNQQLVSNEAKFSQKMNAASRALVGILSVSSAIFFIFLSGIATLLIRKLSAAVKSSETKYKKTFEEAAIGIAQVDEKGRIIDANQALCDIVKYSRKELLNLRYNQLIYADDRRISLKERIALANGEISKLEIKQRLNRSDKTQVWVKITISRVEKIGSGSFSFVGILEDISEQHRLAEELNYQAGHDDLTGLINRRAFERYLKEALGRARSENFDHALCFIDLDQFKIINDTSGHLVGDQILLQATQLLARNLRKSDLLARLGGDEFGLILDCCEPEAAVKVAETLRESIADTPFLCHGKSFTLGCSIGVTPITANSSDITELLQAADSACQMAKEQGRNRVVLTYQGDEELAARRVQMEWTERIRQSFEKDRFFLDAQKLVSHMPQFRERLEVLVRMTDENGEIIPPGAFLPAAERFGLAHLIDRWVIEKVCSLLKANSNFLKSIDAIHINISGRSFDYEDFIDFTLDTLRKYETPGDKICFEITETAAISNLTRVLDFMEKLRNVGSTFALDDFGSGLSSFAYLKQFPVEYLKIDGAFVRNMANDETDRAMVRAISDIGQTLNKVMVAEFVEDAEALRCLKEMQVTYAQGYYLHRPERFEAMLGKTNNPI